MKQLLAVLSFSLLILPGTLRALPDYDPFNYAPVGASLIGQTDPDGLQWFAAGPVGTDPSIAAGSLNVPGLMPSLGNSASYRAVAGPSGRFNINPGGATINSGTIYFSFAFQVRDLTGLGTSGGFMAGFNNTPNAQATTPSQVGTRVLLRASGAGYNVGLDKNSGTAANFQWDTLNRVFTVNDTVFVVGCYTINTATTTDDISQLWINPSSSALGAASPPSGALVATAGADLSSSIVASFLLMQRTAVGVQPALTVADELRIGTTWASVTPPAPPGITQQPANQNVQCGGIATFTVAATGGGTLTYQWFQGPNPVAGATSPTLTINPVKFSDAGPYTCKVSNSSGSATSGAAQLTVIDTISPVVTCPPDLTVNGDCTTGGPVNYLVTAGDACDGPLPFNCNPPSGSNFPIGTTTVNCTATDSHGNVGNCSFKVTVRCAPEGTFASDGLPPAEGVYVSPDVWHQAYANGIIISNMSHRYFLESHPPPPPSNAPIDEVFGSTIEFEQPDAAGGGAAGGLAAAAVRIATSATVTVRVTPAGTQGATRIYNTEMLQLDATLPDGTMIRESPTLASLGKTTVRTAAGGGFLISSFFDIFTEISLDFGTTWSPSTGPAHMELHTDPSKVAPVPAPTPILPPRNDKYISPTEYHALAAQGIIIKDISHKFFTQSMPPPQPGAPAQTHNFDSQVDYQLSTDGGNTFRHGRTQAPVSVSVRHRATDGSTELYDTEMLSLSLVGGDLPPNVLVRESPSKQSLGGTAIDMAPDGTARIHSFFDIFPEISIDGGLTYIPAPQPVRVTLVCDAPEAPFPNPNLPPPESEYISPQKWHQLYAGGIIISNVSHKRFTQSQPPPPPGGQQVHHFDSTIEADLSQNGGATFTHVSGPASVDVRVTAVGDLGSTRYFDTEMLSLNLTLPGGVMVRESPTKASLGRTSIRMVNDPATGIWDYISSFFDIFTEVSTDAGQNWLPSLSGPAEMVAQPAVAGPLSIACPAPMTVTATSPAGAVVTFSPTVSGGCNAPPSTPVCNPPSGSTFPVGTSTVTCSATDFCGQSVQCSFKVTVRPPVPQIFFPGNPPILPPPTGVYISPDLFHRLAAQGIIIKDIRHRRFTQGQPPPPPGGVQVHQFGSQVDMQVSTDGGNTFHPASAPAQCSVRVTNIGSQGNDTAFDTEMLTLDISGGSLPAGVMIRESPSLPSKGKTSIRQVPGGNMIGSFFDIFPEISTDGGQSWATFPSEMHVELRADPALIPPVPGGTPLLPPRNDVYISPALYHQLYQAGIIIKDIRHSFFTHSQPPPEPGQSQVHQFGSQIDAMVSTDSGNTFRSVRTAADVQVRVDGLGGGTFDTEMVQLNPQPLPPGGPNEPTLLIRESPTLPSRGGTQIDVAPDGSYRIGSFFDIFTEVSLDGGQTWLASLSGPAHVELICDAPPQPYPTPNLPPPGQYVSPQQWHAYFAQGIVIRNVSHRKFLEQNPPPLPPPGGSQTHTFSSEVAFELSQDGGNTFQPMTAPASVQARVDGTFDDYGSTRFFDTEMLALNAQGGSLPAGVMLRESPSKQSLGRTSIETMPDGTYRIGSFFDIFTEVSLDGGQNWLPALGEPAHMVAQNPGIPPVGISCPANITATASVPAGAVVTFAPTPSGGCSALTVVCNPPSSSTFPIGTTTVICTASDTCGQSATCSFTVTVNRNAPTPIFFPGDPPILPPPTGMYISPQLFHRLAAAGIYIKDIRHRRFTGGQPPPAPGAPPQTHLFSSMVDMQISTDGGNSYQKVSAPANCTVRVSSVSSTGGVAIAAAAPASIGTQTFDTEMLALNISGGSLPAGVMIRESPTRASTGKTSVRQVPGGNMIGSFFDIFPEISTDGGANWTPTDEPATVELRGDPTLVAPIPASTPLLPPRNDVYISPALYHALFAQGIIIKDIRHSFFTHSQPPPEPGQSQQHQFGSQIDMQVSTDNGQTYTPVRASADVAVRVDGLGGGTFDTEMLSLSFSWVQGPQPLPWMIRESPTLPSRGGTQIDQAPDGSYRIGSFFDIFPEISTDGGQTWLASQSGPAHVELICDAPPQPFPTPQLPPPNGEYISPQKWHALYAQGIIISNVNHKRFIEQNPPPLPQPGASATHTFSSTVMFGYSHDGGATFQQVSAPALCEVRVDGTFDDYGSTRFFDTEMLALNISGGSLPGGVMVRESPSKASLGRTSVETMPDGTYRIGSFFDIFTEVSLDGGQNWLPALSSPAHMVVQAPGLTPVAITCPAPISVTTTTPAGAVVNYPPPTASGGCSALTVVCNPPSGSAFPVGTSIVTCTACDTCGQCATCTFTVTVKRLPPPIFFPGGPLLPPPTGVYISPDLFHRLVAQGIIIKDIRHRRFTQGQPPPPPGGSQIHQFGSVVDMQVSTDGGNTYQPVSAPAQVSVRVTSAGNDGTTTSSFDTEMLQLDIQGPGFMIRESPTRASTGKTTITPVNGGNMIGSFFDVFTEVTLDGGQNWTPMQDAATVELRRDAALIPPVPASTPLLPPRNDAYISPALYHQLYAQGIIIKDVRHSFFTHSEPPPQPGQTQIHQFGSQVDMQVSTDNGNTFRPARASADVTVRVVGMGGGTFDTEMLALNGTGDPDFDLLRIRESPTLPSRGGTQIDQAPDGSFRIGSFFDVFTEISLDGGQNWLASQSGPAHVELICDAPPIPFPNPNLPPAGEYISPQKWHAYYQQGIIISNVSHKRFTDSQPPPPPGGSQTHSFGSIVSAMVSLNNGASFQQVDAQATCTVRVDSTEDDFGDTRFFDTEMLALDITGLPGGVMVRESPSKASLGRTSVRMVFDPATGIWDYISSFFDIFTEVSTDGGISWSAALSGPAHMVVTSPVLTPVNISCPADIVTTATVAAGAVVNYPPPTASGGCGPLTVVCNPPSGSTFPVGTTVVTCTAKDDCGNSATCTFHVTVKPLGPPEIFFPGIVLPPPTGVYISPALYHQLYQNGIIIRDIKHRRFTQGQPPPPPGGSQVHTFSSTVEGQVSSDGGVTWFPFSGTADCQVRVTSAGNDGDKQIYQTEMLALTLTAGNIRLRESPTLQSTGQTTVRPVPGGYMIGSFFDIFTEISLDGGVTRSPSQGPSHVELRKDPTMAVSPITVPSNRLPPPNDYYISPARWHALYAQGIIIKDVRHKFFTDSQHPPAPGQSQIHKFNSQLDFNVSSDGGITFHPGRAPASVEVLVSNIGSSGQDGLFDTEMVQLSATGGDLGATMIRESPSLPSRGGTAIQRQANGLYQINSFFDVFTELSTDGGQSWSPATTGPTGVGLVCNAPEQPEPTPELPPKEGQYVSPNDWHAQYANGVIISNVAHLRFTQSTQPPPPGETSTHQFGSTIELSLSTDGGHSWSRVSAPATVETKVTSTISDFSPDGSSLRYFDTEMTSMSLQGGGLPPNIRIRESPTKQSLGRTSIRQGSGGFGLVNPPTQVSSFFDVFTEVSLDGGQTWSASDTLPSSMALLNCVGPASLSIALNGDGTAKITWSGTNFRLQCTEKLDEPNSVWTDVGARGNSATVQLVPGKARFYRVICP